jgi:hypothetical protein
MIIEILLALFLILLLRLLDGWVEWRRDVLHYVTKPSSARDNAGRPERESKGVLSRAGGKLIAQQYQSNPANESQRASRYSGDAGEHHDRRPQGWNGLLLHRFLPSMLQNEVGISEQEPKPDRRHNNQGDRRDDPKVVMRH